MKNIFKISILFLFFLSSLTFVNQGFAMQSITNDKITLLSPEEALNYIGKKGVYLLDVRTEAEYAEKHLEGSVHIPLPELHSRLNEIISELPHNKKILIRCRSGKRAQKAAKILAPTLPQDIEIYVINGAVLYPE